MKKAFMKVAGEADCLAGAFYKKADYVQAQKMTAAVLALTTMGACMAAGMPSLGIACFYVSAFGGVWLGRKAHQHYNRT